MTQPPLSRAIRQLEDELGVVLLDRTAHGVAPTAAGATLYEDARALLEQAERLRARVTVAAGAASITVGTLADSAEHVGGTLVVAFRRQHPRVDVRIHEADLSDPTAGLRAGLVDVALTRAPFDDSGIATRVLRSEPVGVVLRADDPLAQRTSVSSGELGGRPWIRLPDGTDAVWSAYWTLGAAGGEDAGHPAMRTIQECLQSVLWNGRSALAPLSQALPGGLVIVPVSDRPPSRLVVAWRSAAATPMVRSFVLIAVRSYRSRPEPVQAGSGSAAERGR
jgi:DNA-binding transcriptional LysR family regulator